MRVAQRNGLLPRAKREGRKGDAHLLEGDHRAASRRSGVRAKVGVARVFKYRQLHSIATSRNEGSSGSSKKVDGGGTIGIVCRAARYAESSAYPSGWRWGAGFERGRKADQESAACARVDRVGQKAVVKQGGAKSMTVLFELDNTESGGGVTTRLRSIAIRRTGSCNDQSCFVSSRWPVVIAKFAEWSIGGR